MKFSALALVFVTLASSSHTSSAVNSHFYLRQLSSTDENDEYSFSLIASDDYYDPRPNAPLSACIQVKNNHVKRNQKLVLGNCEGPKPGWHLDANGLLRTELDPDWCMQAGTSGAVQDGEFVRMRKCDPNKELQKFVVVNGGGIRPASKQDYCMVWRGAHANVGVDPIIFKKCVDVDERNDWSGI